MNNEAGPVVGTDNPTDENAFLNRISHLVEHQAQTSEVSEFPPLKSAKLFRRLRGDEKRKHTKLITKIVKYINDRGTRSGVKVYRTQLADQLEECTRAHQEYIGAEDYDARDDPDGENYMRDIEQRTSNLYVAIDEYIKTRSRGTNSISSSVESSASRRPTNHEEEGVQNPLNRTDNTKQQEPLLSNFNQQFMEFLAPIRNTAGRDTSDIGASASAVVPDGTQQPIPNNNASWLTINNCYTQLVEERQRHRETEAALLKAKEQQIRNQAESERLARELQQVEQTKLDLHKMRTAMEEDRLQRELSYQHYRDGLEQDRRRLTQANEIMLKNLDDKLRRFEEINHASSVAAENAKADTIKSSYTGAIPKQLQFRTVQLREEHDLDDFDADTACRAGKQSCNRAHSSQPDGGSNFSSGKPLQPSESDDSCGRADRGTQKRSNTSENN